MNSGEVLAELRRRANGKVLSGMGRFGIKGKHMLGVSIPEIRQIAKKAGKDHTLAAGLWRSGIHEARILACMIDEPARVTEAQMERWAAGFDSWDLCDQCCGSLFDKTRYAYSKAMEWSGDRREFVKRAGYSIMASLAVHDKMADDSEFTAFLPFIKMGATDGRNFVRKGVSWALRQIGKRNSRLRIMAIRTAEEIKDMDSGSSGWIASDVLRELGR